MRDAFFSVFCIETRAGPLNGRQSTYRMGLREASSPPHMRVYFQWINVPSCQAVPALVARLSAGCLVGHGSAKRRLLQPL